MTQFVVEASTLCVLGGLLGVGMGYGARRDDNASLLVWTQWCLRK